MNVPASCEDWHQDFGDPRVAAKFALAVIFLLTLFAFGQHAHAAEGGKPKFKRVLTQFIAALGEPGANAGGNAQSWGLWREDPGPRGVMLEDFAKLEKTGGVAPEGWKFDRADWWLEEHGLIMEQPKFPLAPGRYLVTGDREVTTVLTIHPADGNGKRRWELADKASLHDVTHLGCRSARYTPAADVGSCVPARVKKSGFPVDPGGAMPPVEGCNKQDYAVLFVIGVEQ